MEREIFIDKRSKSVVFVAHCILNQNAKSDGTASYPGVIKEIFELLNTTNLGIIQMPCPELHCLGLDRGDINGSTRPVIEENTRIRKMMSQEDTITKTKQLIQQVIYQIIEYIKHGFEVKGIIGINRSPTCGVDSTSENNKEIKGEGVFIAELHKELIKNDIHVDIVGIKVFEPENAIITIKKLLRIV